MRPSELFVDRFELISRAGAGGMGTVWRVFDRGTGTTAALKVLRDPDGGDAARFLHEGRILGALEHAHIVRYIQHGVAPSGEPYLVMEWLEGESLAERLSRSPLTIAETVQLSRRIAAALGAAHAQGFIHRDVKPSNVFLVEGNVEKAKVLDFGIARQAGLTGHLTQTGSILGTPGYMAPEQARGEHDIRPAADVFALGCVIFECIAGRPAFQGTHPMALLAKLLFEETPPLREICPDVPESLADLVTQMLRKDATARLADGSEVVKVLSSLTDTPFARTVSIGHSSSRAITGTERRIVSIAAVTMPRATADMALAPTKSDNASPDLVAAFQRVAAPFGAEVEVLATGTMIAVLTSDGSAADQAAAAARCSLWIKGVAPEASVALVTGRAAGNKGLPIGEALERAAVLLDQTGGLESPVRIDSSTQALLDSRFVITEEQGKIFLRDERRIGEEPRLLLGRASPFVGRDRDMRNVLSLIEEAFEEGRPVAALVTAGPGMGKSRMRQELVRAIRASHPDVGFVLSRPDAIGAGSAFGLLADAIRGSLLLTGGEPIEAQRDKIKLLVNAYAQGEKARRMAEFIGELVSTPFPDDESPRLRAARQNPQLMAEQIQQAYVELMGAVSSSRPVLLVLEDLHWGDAPSIKLLDAVLRDLTDRPIAILGFARPEVREVFPRLWSGRNCHEIRLGPLSRRASMELVSSVLGASISSERSAAIVEVAEGNAFYLEELIRSVAEGREDALPETILGMVEARLSCLSPPARRILRAASVFGEVFWKNGVSALLAHDPLLGTELSSLCAHELITKRVQSRFSEEEEYAFRHALLREGAYAMLAEQDRMLGHRMAAEWLERRGETDPTILAEHSERGGNGERAAEFYLQAAEQALRGADQEAAVSYANRGLTCGAKGNTETALHALLCEAHVHAVQHSQALEHGRRAMASAAPGSFLYCRTLPFSLSATQYVCDLQTLAELMQSLLTITPEPAGLAPTAMSFCSAVLMLLSGGQRDAASAYFRRLEQLFEQVGPAADAQATSWLESLRGAWARHAERDSFRALAHDLKSVELVESICDSHTATYLLHVVGTNFLDLGALAAAEEYLQRALAAGGGGFYRNLAEQHCAFLALHLGRLDEATTFAKSYLGAVQGFQNVYFGADARALLMVCHTRRGELELAEEILLEVGDFAGYPFYQTICLLSAVAELRLSQGKAEEAARLSGQALAMVRGAGLTISKHEIGLPLLHVLALRACGDQAAFAAALAEAKAELLERVEKIPDEQYRKSFLEIPPRARLLALATEVLG